MDVCCLYSVCLSICLYVMFSLDHMAYLLAAVPEDAVVLDKIDEDRSNPDKRLSCESCNCS